ncbi:MAG: AAA family ATPase [Patescibacteria group bacterium]|nr:AAA family ATPase [Patescibacteria group bacterium]
MYYSRQIFSKLLNELNSKEIVVLTGSRQVGKTVLLRMLEEEVKKRNEKTIFLDLDLAENLESFSTLANFLSFLKISGIDLQNRAVVFIDEFQHSPSATAIMKNLSDHYPNLKIFASGSSSVEIYKFLKETLTGRKIVYKIHPLSFEEFLEFKREEKYLNYIKNWTPEINLGETETDIFLKLLEEFLIFGGYPRVALQNTYEEKIIRLKEVYESYIKKDIKGIIKSDNLFSYNKLIEILAVNNGRLLNINKIAVQTGFSRGEIEKYLFLLNETFVIRNVNPFFSNKLKEITKMPKVYFEDTGLRNLAINNFNNLAKREDNGILLENFAANEISKLNLLLWDLKFWRTKMQSEVDFIFQKNNIIYPIEVKFQKFKAEKDSIPSGIKSFINQYHCKKAIVVNINLAKRIKIADGEIIFTPFFFLAKFLKEL